MPEAASDAPWDMASQERDHRERWRRTTPSERLAWLERAIRFADAAGALPRQHQETSWPSDPLENLDVDDPR